jgi:hypothetical protein
MPRDRFTDPTKHPSEADLRQRIGPAYAPIQDVVTALQTEHRGIAFEWQLSKTSGWHLVCNKGKRRLFYLFPRDGDFLLKVVFNDTALAAIKAGSFPATIGRRLAAARRYPEGTLLELDGASFEAATVLELLRVKLAR